MQVRLLVAMVGLGLAGCAGPQQNANTASGEPHKVCKEEMTTGTNISHRVCRTPAQVEEERKAGQDFVSTPLARPTGAR